MQGLLGKKVGMTRVFDGEGRQIPVTVLEVGPCVVLDRKTRQRDGYEALRVGFGAMKESRGRKPDLGQFRKAGTAPCRYVREFPLEEGDEYKAGDTVTAAIFEQVGYVDVTGVTKGRGFQGVVRRYRMAGGPHTHGGHSKRRPGAVGCRTDPGRIHKLKHMPGHMGNVRVTVQNLKVIGVRGEEGLVLVQGAVPGANGGLVMVRKSLKKPSGAK